MKIVGQLSRDHKQLYTQHVFSSNSKFPKSATVPTTSNFAIRVWSIKYRRKKLIAQFGWKLRDERFKPN